MVPQLLDKFGLAETLQILIGVDQTNSLDIKSLNKNEIIENMIKKFENSENRKLNSEEIEQIKQYVMNS